MRLFDRWFRKDLAEENHLQLHPEPDHRHEPIALCKERVPASVVGTVKRVEVDEAGPCFRAVLEDDTGSITLAWPGRREIPGISEGTVLSATGTVARGGAGMRILDPQYSIEAVS